MRKLVEIILTGTYLGKLPAPGTFGTLWGIPLAFLLGHFSPLAQIASIVVVILLGVFMVDYYCPNPEQADRSEIVFDEIIGYAVCMALLPQSLVYYILAFILFRILDISKPYPISYIDKNMKGGMGVMLDDVAAAMVVNLILHIIDANWGTWIHGLY